MARGPNQEATTCPAYVLHVLPSLQLGVSWERELQGFDLLNGILHVWRER